MAEEGGTKLEEGEKMLYKPQSVKLVSAEGFEFVIDRKAAIISNTLRTMLSSSGLCSSLPLFRSMVSVSLDSYFAIFIVWFSLFVISCVVPCKIFDRSCCFSRIYTLLYMERTRIT